MIKKITLKRINKRQARPGHPWIYQSQIKDVSDGIASGEIADIYSGEGRFMGVGYYNPRSQISIRMLSQDKEKIDVAFFKKKIVRAIEYRRRLVRDTNALRIVSSEGDDLPGLVIDQYAEVLVLQFLTLGMETLKGQILEALNEAIPNKGIYERSDSSSRRLEGLTESVGWIHRDCREDISIFEKNIKYILRFGEGHKTGFYLDQRENRLFLSELAIKGRVLDAFCYTGGFGLHLASTGCQVLGIDIQKDAIDKAMENRELNKIPQENLEFRVANVFDELRSLEKEKKKFNLVILDPPSFVKKKEALMGALAGYKEIILRSMRLLNAQGYLAVYSCSYHVDENLLMQSALGAAWDAHKSLRVVRFMKQSSDHPINPFIPETYYLKGFLFEVT